MEILIGVPLLLGAGIGGVLVALGALVRWLWNLEDR